MTEGKITGGLKTALGALSGLTQAELATVRAACEHLLNREDTRDDPTKPLYDSVLRAMGGSHHGTYRLRWGLFKGTTTYSTWKKNAPGVVSFIDQTYPQASKVAKMGILQVLLDALLEDLKQRGVPITIGVVVSNLSRLPEIFDTCYPDYRKCGMAGLVLKAMEKKGKANAE